MTDWFRSWHGAPTDPKWLGIAKRAGVAPGIAVSVAWALMDRASQAEDRGSIAGYDADGLACFFGCEPEKVDAIVAAMSDKGMIADGRFASWEKRQPKREDDSSKRVQEHRKRKAEQTKRDVTHRNAPDTETDTDNYTAETRAGAIDARMPELYAALGVTDETKTPGLLSFSDPIQWVTAGCDIDADILPALRTIAARGKIPKSWRYCSDAVFEARDRRLAPPPAVRERGGTGPPRNDLDRMNAALDSLISGQSNEPDLHPRTIDASFERRDWGGSEGAVQRPAIPARN